MLMYAKDERERKICRIEISVEEENSGLRRLNLSLRLYWLWLFTYKNTC